MQTTTEKTNDEAFIIKFASKTLKKLETKTLPKVTFHLLRYHEMSASERDGFQSDFKQFVAKICQDIKGLLPNLPKLYKTQLSDKLKTLTAKFAEVVQSKEYNLPHGDKTRLLNLLNREPKQISQRATSPVSHR